jgi:hypothetical protein
MPDNVSASLKYGAAIGIGIAIGALAVLLLKKDKIGIRDLATDVLSHGIDFKEKAMTLVEGAKETMGDMVAEAVVKQKLREKKADNSETE